VNSIISSFVGARRLAAPLFSAFVLCAIAFPTVSKAWTPTTPQVAVAVIGGVGSDVGNFVITDTAGNVYTAGYFQLTADFDPGVGTVNLTSAGGRDAFVSKMDSSGSLIWVRHFGGASDDDALYLAFDSSQNLYVGGSFRETADFDPGVGTVNLTTAGGQDGFVSKLDSSGNFIWARQVGGTADDRTRSVSVDASNNVYSTGYFQGTADFDPSAGEANLISAGGQDVFVWKLDSSGSLMWTSRFGGALIDNAASIAVGPTGDLFLTGAFYGTSDFDPGAGTANMTAVGVQDSFVAKLDSSGNYAWARQLGSTLNDFGNSVTVDAANNVYTTGTFQSTVDFDPGSGTSNMISSGTSDAYVWKLDTSGGLVWARQVGGSSSDVGNSVTVDASNNLYVAGNFQGTADFDPSADTANLTSSGTSDGFVWKLDALGGLVWARQLGGSSSDAAFAIALDSAGIVYVAGSFNGTSDFDPSSDTANVTSSGATDVFVWKLDLLGFPSVPTTSSTSTTSTSSIATTTTTTPTSTTVVTASTIEAGVSAAAAVTTSTTTSTVVTGMSTTTAVTTTVTESVAPVAASDLPITGSSTRSLLLWAGVLLAGGVIWQMRMRRLDQ
jgi:hypothetical protein